MSRRSRRDNRHIASLAAFDLDDIIARVRLEAAFARTSHLSSTAAGDALRPTAFPVGPLPHVSHTLPVWWEQISPEGEVVASEIDLRRIGSDGGYGEFLSVSGDESLLISPVGEWIPGYPPTVVLADARSGMVAVLDTESLHEEIQAWARGTVDRHL